MVCVFETVSKSSGMDGSVWARLDWDGMQCQHRAYKHPSKDGVLIIRAKQPFGNGLA